MTPGPIAGLEHADWELNRDACLAVEHSNIKPRARIMAPFLLFMLYFRGGAIVSTYLSFSRTIHVGSIE